MEWIARLMPRSKFLDIHHHMYFSDTPDPGTGQKYSITHLVDEIDTHFNDINSQHWKPGRTCCIDEASVPTTCRTPIRRFTPRKPHPDADLYDCLANEQFVYYIVPQGSLHLEKGNVSSSKF